MGPEDMASSPVSLQEQGSYRSNNDKLPNEGLITDSNPLCRLANVRTQRVVPAHGQHPSRSGGRITGTALSCVSSQKHLCDGRHSERVPLRFAASRRYYVIALRRLII